jgi:hypothetical protein
VEDVLSESGQPLDAKTRAFMEPRFGHNFGNVRVHNDKRSADSARVVSAEAFTVGQHIVLRESRASKTLLAHELAHVVQQRGGTGGLPGDGEEADAKAAAASISKGQTAHVAMSSGVGLARSPDSRSTPFTRKEIEVVAKILYQRSCTTAAGFQRWLEKEHLESFYLTKVMPVFGSGEAASAEGSEKGSSQAKGSAGTASSKTVTKPASAEERWAAYKAEVNHAWEISDDDNYRMNAVGRWGSYVDVNELDHFLEKDPGMKRLYDRWLKFYATENVPELHFYQGTPGDPLVEGMVGGEPITARQSEYQAAQFASAVGEGSTLGNIEANVGGAIGYGIATIFTDDPEKLKAASGFGAAVGDIVLAHGQAVGAGGSKQGSSPSEPEISTTKESLEQSEREASSTPQKGGAQPVPVKPPAGIEPAPKPAESSGVPEKSGPMRQPPGGGDRAGMTATEKTLTPHEKSNPVVEVLPRSTVPMKDFEPPEPGHYIRRKPPSAETQPKILARAGHTTDGRLRDTNTGRALNEGEAVWGHAPDFQFKEMRDMAEKAGWTQEKFDEFFEDPAKWQIEYGPTNSGRVFDRIPRQRPVH